MNILWVLAMLSSAAQAAIVSPEHRLLDYLMANHTGKAMPTLKHKTPIDVKLSLELIEILDVDAPQQTIRVNAWMRMIWTNELLVWDPDQFNKIKSVRLDRKTVWIPDITLYNSFEHNPQKAKDQGLPETPIMAFYNGMHRYAYPLIQGFTCTMNPKDFPKDQHTCTMEYGSWSFDETHITLSLERDKVELSEYVESAEWELIKFRQTKYSEKYKCCTVPYGKVNFELTIRRKEQFYVFTTYLPCCILMVCLITGHLLPAESGEKVVLSLSVLLTFFVFLQTTARHVPKSDEISSMGLVLLLSLSGITFSTFLTCMVLNLHFKDSENNEIPQWFQTAVKGLWKKVAPLSAKKESKTHLIHVRSQPDNENLRRYANGLRLSVRSYKVRDGRIGRSISALGYRSYRMRKSWTTKLKQHKLNAKLLKLLSLTKQIRTYYEEDDPKDTINPWQQIAVFIDRIAFAVYTVAAFISAIIFLG